MDYEKSKCERMLLNGNIVEYDYAARLRDDEFNTYKNLKLEYLGSGIIYRVDGVRQSYNIMNNKDIRHFWKLSK